MRHSCIALLFTACVVFASSAQDKDFSKVQMKVTKLSGNVYMLEGGGGNIGASIGEDGIVIVDDQYAPLYDKIRAALKGITDKPIRFVINTHYHELPSSPRTTCANVWSRAAPQAITGQ